MRTSLTLVAIVVVAAVAAGEPGANAPRRVPRAEAFLGIHFDFHANADCNRVGEKTTPAMVDTIIDRVRPDYIQIDCKGHPGYSSYPTKVGTPAPGFVGDPLRVWRDATAARGVALFMHYSGVIDHHAVQRQPDWAARRADGKPHGGATSVFGPYVDQRMIPQLRELAGVYGVDGVWVDGDCWGAVLDYSDRAVAAFRAQTGAPAAPRKPADPLWQEWKEFNREGFRRYLRHYVDAMKASHPQFQTISNWAFSDHMPEPVTADVTALSGDFSPSDSVNSARFAGRCLENQGRPWDLMSWSFNRQSRQQKTAVQLQQEAAVVLSLGGGYQAYFTMNRDGSVRLSEMDVMAEVARFCRQRQPFCHRSEAVPQVALLYSRQGHYRAASSLFHPSGSEGIRVLRRALPVLVGERLSVEVTSEHHMTGRLSRWPLIVVPGWDFLAPSFRDELVAYVKGGGRLLLVGQPAVKLFADASGIGEATDPATAKGRELGKGRIAAIASEAALPAAVKELMPRPLVEIACPNADKAAVDVFVRRLRGRLMVNLVNTSGDHADPKLAVLKTVPPLGSLEVAIRLPKAPKAIVCQPGDARLAVRWADGVAKVTLPTLPIHSVLAVEE